ncbi:uncharacterized protein LOC119684174 isoform X1 [Teleopsis dalmanni]|uniref:uncharacterized protein LOC119684174 isoform X1 n=1 Tax=Teleopsis dalmanni TaxID=139649 RepID=UPI000D32C8C3|nr:uncharacterized protein LOC119684174 isoform X1 [Teleopsis dalmanni]
MKLAITLLVSLISQLHFVDVKGSVISHPATTVIGGISLQPISLISVSKPDDDGSWKDSVEDADDGSYKPQPGNEGEWIDDVTAENSKKHRAYVNSVRLTSIWNDAKISTLPNLQPINKQIVAPAIVTQHSPPLISTVGTAFLKNDGVADGTYAQIPIISNAKDALHTDVSSTVVASRIATIGPNAVNGLQSNNHVINQVNSELITNNPLDISKGVHNNQVVAKNIGTGINPNTLVAKSVITQPTNLFTNKLETAAVSSNIATQPISLLANQLIQKNIASASSLVGNQPTVLLTNQPSTKGIISAVSPNAIAVPNDAISQQEILNSNILAQQGLDTHLDSRGLITVNGNINNEQKSIIAEAAISQPNSWIPNHLPTQSLNAPLEQNPALISNGAIRELSDWDPNQLATQSISAPLNQNNAFITKAASIPSSALLSNQLVQQSINTIRDPNQAIAVNDVQNANAHIANIDASQTGTLVQSSSLVSNGNLEQPSALTTNQLPLQDINGAINPNVVLIRQQPNSWTPNELLQQAIPVAINQNRPAVVDGNIVNAQNTLVANSDNVHNVPNNPNIIHSQPNAWVSNQFAAQAINSEDETSPSSQNTLVANGANVDNVSNNPNIIQSQPNAWISNQFAAQGINSPLDRNSGLIANIAPTELNGLVPNQLIEQGTAAAADLNPVTSEDGSIPNSQNTLIANVNLNQQNQLLANQLINQNINPDIATVADVRDRNAVSADNGASQQGGWLSDQLQEQRLLIGEVPQQNTWENSQLTRDDVNGAVDESQNLQVGGANNPEVANVQEQNNGIGVVANDVPWSNEWNSLIDLNSRRLAGSGVEIGRTTSLNEFGMLRETGDVGGTGGAGGQGGPGGAGDIGGVGGADGETGADGESGSRVVRTSSLWSRDNLLQLAQNTKSQFRGPIVVA